jgi:drug/metabolite transporter (DMT)-like permease
MTLFIQTTLLILTTMVWGLGFVATRWTLEVYDPLWSNSLRYLLAGVLALPVLVIKGSFKGNLRRHRPSLIAGFFLFTSMYLQVWGLNYTSVAKSGFLTTFYVFFTPLLGMIFLHERYPKRLWALIFAALFGVAMMGDLSLNGINRGDFMTLGCAVLGAAHILYIGRIARDISDPVEFNFMQCFTMGFLGSIAAFLFMGLPPLSITGHELALAGLFFLAFFSSLLAFTVQVVAQKAIPAHLVSMIFLLESIFAAAFGWILLDEKLNFLNLIGAVIVLASVLAIPILLSAKKKAALKKAARLAIQEL